MFDKLNAETLLALMKLGASITLPCTDELELNWGELGLKGLTAQDSIELSLFGGKGHPGSKFYFPMSDTGMSQALSFAKSEADKFQNQ